MINVNQITSQLARMPDQALQQYAMMHKNDPYTVSLALSESNRRRQMRDAAQGQQGRGEQPKVVDQGIAQMMAPPPQPQMPQAQAQPMPEDVGIGALPAPNMQGMAEGGIVAFGGGGDVPGFAGGVYVGEGGEYSADPLTAEELAQRDPLARLKQFSAWAGRNVERDPVTGEVARKADIAVPVMGPAVSAAYPDETRRGAAAALLPAAPGGKPPTAAPRAPKIAGLKDAAAPTGMDFAEQYKALRGKLSDTDPYAGMIAERSRMAKEQGAERSAEFEKDVAKQGDVYAAREARLVKRGEDITKQGETNTGLAFLNAGLAIMSTPGGLATAIGKGARVGTEQFAAGLDKIKAAQDRLADAQDRAEELKQTRADMTTQQRRQIKTDINKDVLAAQDLAIAGARDAGARNDKVAAAALEQAGAFQRTKMTTDATKAAAATTAGAAASRLGLAGERLALDTLTAQAKTLADQIKETPNYGEGKAKRATLQRSLDAINLQLGGGTIPAPSAVAPPGGNRPALGSFQR